MAVADVIRRRTQQVTLSRPSAAVITDGYAAPGTPTVSTIAAHVQPLQPQEVRDLPPGQNATDWRNVWSETELKINDQVTVDGLVLTVKRDEFWKEGTFYRVQATITRDQI